MEWTTACPDWERKIVAKHSLMPCEPLFPDMAEMALDVFKRLVVVDVAGSPPMGEITKDWVFEFVAAIFGSYDQESGRRLISEFLLLISKKNTKSTIAAGIMLTALILNWRVSGEFLILAPTKEIADNSFIPVRDMIKADESLSALFQVQEHTRTVTHRTMGATLKVVAADSDTVGGKKAIGVLIDELWLFGKQANAENMFREATGGLASRPEGFVIFLTTQADQPPAGVMAQKLQYARGVRDGRIKDKKFLPLLYEFPQWMLDEDKHKDPQYFYVTNPNLGTSVDEEFLVREFRKAEEAGDESMCGFLAKHLNVEIGIGLRSNRWAGADFWAQQALSSGLSLDDILDRCEVVTAGIDGGGLDDFLGLAILGREKETRRWLLWTHAWAHEIVLERRKKEAARFDDFRRDGDLTVVKVAGDDVAEVGAVVAKVHFAGLLDKVGLDPLGLGGLIDGLLDAGVPESALFQVSQGYKLAGYTKTAERKLAEGALVHGGQRLMSWCVGNAKVKVVGNNGLITKQEAGSAKIDPLIATFNAVALMSLNPESKGRMDDFINDMIMVGI